MLIVRREIILNPNVTLDFGQQLVVYFQIALRCPSNQNFLVAALHVIDTKLVHLAVVWASKHFKLECFIGHSLLLGSFRIEIDHNICFAHVYEHVVLELSRRILHFFEDTEPYAKVFDEIVFSDGVEPNLEVSALMLLGSLLVARWDDKVIDHNQLLIEYISISIEVGQSTSHRPKVGETVLG